MLDYANTQMLDSTRPDQDLPLSRHPSRLLPKELKALYEHAGRRIAAKEGSVLVREGGLFHDLYAVRTGSFKAYVTDERGREQRRGFFLHGDIIGFDAIETGRHAVSVMAMEASEVIAVPTDTLARIAAANPGFLAAIMRRMAEKIAVH